MVMITLLNNLSDESLFKKGLVKMFVFVHVCSFLGLFKVKLSRKSM